MNNYFNPKIPKEFYLKGMTMKTKFFRIHFNLMGFIGIQSQFVKLLSPKKPQVEGLSRAMIPEKKYPKVSSLVYP
jgi:hypothetical protein